MRIDLGDQVTVRGWKLGGESPSRVLGSEVPEIKLLGVVPPANLEVMVKHSW